MSDPPTCRGAGENAGVDRSFLTPARLGAYDIQWTLMLLAITLFYRPQTQSRLVLP